MEFLIPQRVKIICYALIAIGVSAVVSGFFTDVQRTWANLLTDNFYFMAMALFGTFFIAMQYATESAWSVTLKRIPEAMSQYLWVAAPLMLVIFLAGHDSLYHWTHHGITEPGTAEYDAAIAEKSAYLNIPFFLTRMVIFLGVWLLCTYLLRKYSLLQDKTGGITYHKKSIIVSALFLVFFAVTSVVSAWDWLMSLEPHWYSTMFGWYIFGGTWCTGTAMAILFILYLKKQGHLTTINENHIHDMGKWLFALSCLWTYLWFSQFMLIWYANIPEEVTFFVPRMRDYPVLFFGMLFLNFLIPFLLLMSRDSKRNPAYLLVTSLIVIAGHWLDIFIIVMPATVGEHWTIGWVEAGTFLGFLGAFILITMRSLQKAPLQVKEHPFLEECLHHHI